MGSKLIELFYKRFMERFGASKGIILEVIFDHSIYSSYY